MKDIFVKLLATTTTSAAFLSTGPDLSAIQSIDPSKTCPSYKCDTIHSTDINMDEQVFCYK